ncbi:hypothetical protein WA556_004061 [Blastocystis sp. ATCC 50177/Nand II]
MLSVKSLNKVFREATESTSIEFVMTKNGEVMMSTIDNMNYEGVFLSALGRCWKGFDILENNPMQYQIYTYEQCNAVVTPCCGKYLIAGVANHSIPIGKVKCKLFSLRDFIEEEFKKLNCS